MNSSGYYDSWSFAAGFASGVIVTGIAFVLLSVFGG